MMGDVILGVRVYVPVTPLNLELSENPHMECVPMPARLPYRFKGLPFPFSARR